MSHSKPGCTVQVKMVSQDDLPLSCPTKHERVWDAHPRVYLPIVNEKEVVCPYCDTKYILEA